MIEPDDAHLAGAEHGSGPSNEPDALARAQLRAAHERTRFEQELDRTRDLLERRTAALERAQRDLARVRGQSDRLESYPVIRAWVAIRGGLARLERAPRRVGRSIFGRGRQTGRAVPATSEVHPTPVVATETISEPGAYRAQLQARLLGGAEPPRVVVLGQVAQPLIDAVRSSGWTLTDLADNPHPDFALVADPAADLAAIPRDVIRVGWVPAGGDDWLAAPGLEDLDLVLAGPTADRAALESVVGTTTLVHEPAALSSALAAYVAAPRLAIQIGPATWEAAAHWGDTAFARALERAFRRLGWATFVLVDAESDGATARRADVALHVTGLRRPPLHPGQTHLLWIISHPDAVRPERCNAYDTVFVASDPFAEQLRLRVDVPVVALHQATDPRRFFPESGGPKHDLLFVGNSRNRKRPVLDALAGTLHELAVYGTNWRPELLDPRRLLGEWVPNEDLHRFYSAATIVLNDHWPDMREEGFISNRVYDALASGAFVLTDDVPGLQAEFDGGLGTWLDAESLRTAVDRYLPDAAARAALAERGRHAVLERHTFDHRVATILQTVKALGTPA